MPRQKQEGPTRQIYAAIREDIYLAAKSRAAELRIPMREYLERALELALGGESPEDPVAEPAAVPSVWDDEYIGMQAKQPVGSPVELSEDEASAIVRGSFGQE
jgi:hypothetical protein